MKNLKCLQKIQSLRAHKLYLHNLNISASVLLDEKVSVLLKDLRFKKIEFYMDCFPKNLSDFTKGSVAVCLAFSRQRPLTHSNKEFNQRNLNSIDRL